jgi:hypothetical protein
LDCEGEGRAEGVVAAAVAFGSLGALLFRWASIARCCRILSAELVNMYRHRPAGRKSMKAVIMDGIM